MRKRIIKFNFELNRCLVVRIFNECVWGKLLLSMKMYVPTYFYYHYIIELEFLTGNEVYGVI